MDYLKAALHLQGGFFILVLLCALMVRKRQQRE